MTLAVSLPIRAAKSARKIDQALPRDFEAIFFERGKFFHASSSDSSNQKSIGGVRNRCNDRFVRIGYLFEMAEPEPDWYLKQWLATLNVKQSRLVDKSDYSKSQVSEMVNGKQRYNKDVVNTFAEILGIKPWELLMPPSLAMRARSLEDAVTAVAIEQQPKGAE